MSPKKTRAKPLGRKPLKGAKLTSLRLQRDDIDCINFIGKRLGIASMADVVRMCVRMKGAELKASGRDEPTVIWAKELNQ